MLAFTRKYPRRVEYKSKTHFGVRNELGANYLKLIASLQEKNTMMRSLACVIVVTWIKNICAEIRPQVVVKTNAALICYW